MELEFKQLQLEFKNKPFKNDGEWNKEPSFGKFEYDGVDFYIIRSESMGHLCGYVSIKDHVLSTSDYSHSDVDNFINVHGGITYDECYLKSYQHDHFKYAKENDHLIGFDCAHYNDTQPNYLQYYSNNSPTYKNFEFVKNECIKLAKFVSWSKNKTIEQLELYKTVKVLYNSAIEYTTENSVNVYAHIFKTKDKLYKVFYELIKNRYSDYPLEIEVYDIQKTQKCQTMVNSVFYCIDLDKPYNQIVEKTGTVKLLKKIWFIATDKKVHLVGSSAFQTYNSAKTARLGTIAKVLKWSRFHQDNGREALVEQCKSEKGI